MHKGGVAVSAAIPTRSDALEPIQPGKEPLDFPASLILLQYPTILGGRFLPTLAMRGNQLNALRFELFSVRITVIGTISNKSSYSSHSDTVSDGSFDKGDFMW